jgi:hypothetical protein
MMGWIMMIELGQDILFFLGLVLLSSFMLLVIYSLLSALYIKLRIDIDKMLGKDD